MTRRDAVPPEVALEVFERDQGCLAPRLGGTAMDCGGQDRLEHVKVEPRAAKRAEPLTTRLLVLCEGHTEPGMKAGYVWCTDRTNRARCRAYLAVWARFGRVLHRSEWRAWLYRPQFDGRTAMGLIVEDEIGPVLAALDALGEGVFV